MCRIQVSTTLLVPDTLRIPVGSSLSRDGWQPPAISVPERDGGIWLCRRTRQPRKPNGTTTQLISMQEVQAKAVHHSRLCDYPSSPSVCIFTKRKAGRISSILSATAAHSPQPFKCQLLALRISSVLQTLNPENQLCAQTRPSKTPTLTFHASMSRGNLIGWGLRPESFKVPTRNLCYSAASYSSILNPKP